jgi:hypothetical protein
MREATLPANVSEPGQGAVRNVKPQNLGQSNLAAHPPFLARIGLFFLHLL